MGPSKFYMEKTMRVITKRRAKKHSETTTVICNGKTLVCLYRPKHLFLVWSWYETR